VAETNPSLLQILRRRFWIALAVFVLTAAGGSLLVWEILPQIYTATAIVQIDDPTPHDPEAMESLDLLTAIIDNLNLKQIWGERTLRKEPLSSDEALALLKAKLKIANRPDTNNFEVTVTSKSPEEAAQILNEMMVLYESAEQAEEATHEHQGERDDLKAKIALQHTWIQKRTEERDLLIPVLAQKGIPVPSDDLVLQQLARGQDPKEDPQLRAYKRTEHELMVRQSILGNLTTQLEMMNSAALSKKSRIQISIPDPVPRRSSSVGMTLGVLISIFGGGILAAATAMALEGGFWRRKASAASGGYLRS